jgi:outer membrane protein OmpU
MKKILLATTMLAGTAGFAAAEVALSGYAEMGIYSGASGDVEFWQDVDVTFSMTGTTDGGLEFGASVDLDEADWDDVEGVNALDDSTDDNGYTVWISGAFGKLTMGDTDGALDWAVADMDGGLTSLADDHTTHNAVFLANGYDGAGDGQIVRYENTFGDVGFAVSAEQGDEGVGVVDDIFAVGVKYNADLGGTAVALGLGYQDAGSEGSAVGVSAGAALAGGFGGKIGYIDFSDDAGGVDSHLGLEVTYASGPIGVSVNYGKVDLDAGGDYDSWGLVANYDLGGGAKVMFGYGSDVVGGNTTNEDQWSLGLGMSF